MTSILQFADIHLGAEDREAMAAVAAMAETLEPDINVICGDITQSGKREEFEAAARWIDGLPGPKLICPGNHDTPVYNLLERFTDPFGFYDEIIAPLSLDVFVDDDCAITAFNTARGFQFKLDWSVGVVDLDVLGACIDRLNAVAHPRDKVRMIACHHPMIYPPKSPLDKETANGPEALAVMSDRHVDAVLTGHIHLPFVKDREPGASDILSIGAGTLSTRRRGVESSFNHIQIDDDTLRVTAIDWVDGAYLRRAEWAKSRTDLAA